MNIKGALERLAEAVKQARLSANGQAYAHLNSFGFEAKQSFLTTPLEFQIGVWKLLEKNPDIKIYRDSTREYACFYDVFVEGSFSKPGIGLIEVERRKSATAVSFTPYITTVSPTPEKLVPIALKPSQIKLLDWDKVPKVLYASGLWAGGLALWEVLHKLFN